MILSMNSKLTDFLVLIVILDLRLQCSLDLVRLQLVNDILLLFGGILGLLHLDVIYHFHFIVVDLDGGGCSDGVLDSASMEPSMAMKSHCEDVRCDVHACRTENVTVNIAIAFASSSNDLIPWLLLCSFGVAIIDDFI